MYSEKPESDPKDNLGEGKNTLGSSFHDFLCQNLVQLSLKATRPIALLMVGRISGFGLSAEINQMYNLRVTLAM